MKNIIAVLGLFIIPFIASANISLDDGKYYNLTIDKKVRINCQGNSIKARGLVNYDWTKFRSCGHREYVDRHGNSIRVVGHNSFEFRARNRNRVIVFHRDGLGDRIGHEVFGSCTNSCSSNCTIHGHGGHGNSGYNGHSDRQDRGYDDYSSNGGYSSSQGLEGVWSNSQYSSDVIVERTNEGLRAKLIGSDREWTYYRQDSYDKKEYIDNRGNRYVARSSRELVWYPEKSGSPIVLRRLR